jgi:hypothetical protein
MREFDMADWLLLHALVGWTDQELLLAGAIVIARRAIFLYGEPAGAGKKLLRPVRADPGAVRLAAPSVSHQAARMAAERAPDRDRALVVAEKLARVMDGMYLDPILGFFVPWAGDVIGAGLGLYPVLLAWRRGAPKVLIARMLLNLSVDLLAGAVPILGDVWDFFFRAHRRNLALLRSRSRPGSIQAHPRDGLVVAGAVALFLVALATPLVLLVVVVKSIGW